MGPTADITGLLVAVSNGEEAARTQLIEAVSGELCRLAAGDLRRERPDHSLPPTRCVGFWAITPERTGRSSAARALEKLSEIYPRQGQLVELRLDVAPITVKRDWALARAWLHREMRGQPV